MQIKQKNLTSALKKISANIESGRKNIETDNNLTQNLHNVKRNFNEVQSVIKGQIPALQNMKNFTKEFTSQSSKNLQIKRFFNSYCERARVEFKQYLQVVKQNFVVNLKSKSTENWEKVQKELEKYLNSLKDQAENTQKIYASINKINAAKDQLLTQFFKLMLYKKNVLWRDLNAPYDDFIHGQIKNSINLIKQNEEKYGYIPNTLEFSLPKFQIQQVESNLPQILRIIMIDHRQIIQGLKNYSKLSDEPQIIEDISKNQHIVKGLRQRIQLLTTNYDNLMQKYRTLQISKGKSISGPQEQKSLTQKLQQMQNFLIKKQQQIIQLRQMSLKQDSLMANLKQKNKQLQDQLSKWHKYQIPKIKEMQVNQKSLLEQFNKVKRDLQTYSSLLQNQRQQKIKTLQQLKLEKERVHDMANILGRERRKIKELKLEIIRQQKIVMELVDKIPQNC